MLAGSEAVLLWEQVVVSSTAAGHLLKHSHSPAAINGTTAIERSSSDNARLPRILMAAAAVLWRAHLPTPCNVGASIKAKVAAWQLTVAYGWLSWGMTLPNSNTRWVAAEDSLSPYTSGFRQLLCQVQHGIQEMFYMVKSEQHTSAW